MTMLEVPLSAPKEEDFEEPAVGVAAGRWESEMMTPMLPGKRDHLQIIIIFLTLIKSQSNYIYNGQLEKISLEYPTHLIFFWFYLDARNHIFFKAITFKLNSFKPPKLLFVQKLVDD